MSLESLLSARVSLLPVLGLGLALLAIAILSRRRGGFGPAAAPLLRPTPDRHYLRLLFEQLPVIVWSVDRELRVTSAAGSGLPALGVAPGELVGLALSDLLGAEAGTTRALDMHRRGLAGEAVAYTVSWRSRDFQVRLDALRADGGEIVGCVGVALDVTERRRHEASWSETQRLESLGILAGGIAHDFANLLTGVLGHAELALLRLAPGDPARGHLEQAIEGAHRGGDLTRQLLAYAGRGEARREAVELAPLVRGMGELLRVALGTSCDVRYELQADAPAIEADAAQLRQIVMNLLTNGAEAIGERGGTLTVATASRAFSADELAGYQFGEALPPGDYVALHVSDTGAGMGDEIRARIFEPFFSTKRAGRGLGLAAVLDIVRGHGGALRVDSAPGRGTTFEILFPPLRERARLAG